ncbi:hypothetical protein VCUG_00736 [Vavraia culicis subsp. floridensis]|uniref:DNA recombination and repair protein Rad51-like C-terminal domain-containing protein n=1 Tax=Vavraia culicis (isolate floridensis) TaxID=948595 RepID=L2GXE4_VAVCU|nr:uncharacterized protein VCUG_00736 [Vavraia culicis subsp. floridensis]ELA47775.1 hypothetical protein VCUG_00736 [Vavraia culicis subsp. floridensis]
MLEYNGIVEIAGKKGSGRTNLVLKESLCKRTLFISVKPFPINRYADLLTKKYGNSILEIDNHLNNTFIIIISQIEKMEAFILHKLDSMVKQHGIALIVLYEIDFVLLDDCIEMSSIFHIMNKLHRIRHSNGLHVVFVTLYRKVFSYNYNIRMSMEYFINERYHVIRRNGERTITRIGHINDGVFNMQITNDDVTCARAKGNEN